MNSISFKRGCDPYAKLSIGPKVLIDNWFKQWEPDVDYDIDDELNIAVNWNLDLYNSEVSELPDNLTVNGWLDLEYTKITELPDNLTVNGFLALRRTKVSKLPDNLIVEGTIFKDF